MKTKKELALTLAVATTVLAGSTNAGAAVTLYAEYLLGEPGSLGASNVPLDSVGGRNIDTTINPGPVTVGAPGAHAGSSAFLDTSDPANSGYYHPGNFADLPTDNVAIGVYARAASLDAANHGTIFGTGEGGLDLSLQTNGWSGSIFNVAWVAEPGGVTGSFTMNQWTHLALVRAEGVTTFYIDGVAQPGTYGGAIVNALPHVSVSPGGFSYFDGGIDDARVVTFDPGEPTTNIIAALQGVPEPTVAVLLAIAGAAFVGGRRRVA